MPDTASRTDAPTVADLLCFSLYSASHAMNRVYQPLLAELGLTYPQYLVLVSLWEKDRQLVGELCETLFLESSTLTPLLKRLEALGHVERCRDPDDERRVRVSLTRSGKRLHRLAACLPEKILAATGMSEAAVRELNRKITGLRRQLAASSRR